MASSAIGSSTPAKTLLRISHRHWKCSPLAQERARFSTRALLAVLLAGGIVAFPVAAQEMPAGHHHSDTTIPKPSLLTIGASAIALGTMAKPGVANRTLIEGYLTQPMVMGSLALANRRVVAEVILNFEGLTLDRGELNAGVYGEGYVDRRHPHTWLHEAVVSALVGKKFSVTAGKGFVPFGTDDPMSRPMVKYPVNHHLAQLLERAMVIVAASNGELGLEAAVFNGDEPESPGDMPDLSNLGNSWSLRATARNEIGLEIQGSYALVKSPEIAQGGGLDHGKWSVSGRYEKGGRYALLEWAMTNERENGNTAFSFNSLLAEAAIPVRRVKLSFRAERTERPEEERLANVFRTPRPHGDLSIHGQTRWNVLTAGASTEFDAGRGRLSPFFEISTQHPVASVYPTSFEPRDFYGVERLWSVSVGIRAGIGMNHMRMGRYGVAATHQSH